MDHLKQWLKHFTFPAMKKGSNFSVFLPTLENFPFFSFFFFCYSHFMDVVRYLIVVGTFSFYLGYLIWEDVHESPVGMIFRSW